MEYCGIMGLFLPGSTALDSSIYLASIIIRRNCFALFSNGFGFLIKKAGPQGRIISAIIELFKYEW
jgi:hypothetical protein